MIDNNTLPSPFIVAVLENYYDERPENVIIDISKLPVDHGYRRAVVDALNNEDHPFYRMVSYDTLQSVNVPNAYLDNGKGVTIQGSVTLDEDGGALDGGYDGYTIPEDWDEEDIADHEARVAAKAAGEANNPAPHLSEPNQRWIAAMYHGPVAEYDADLLAKQFSTTPEAIRQIADMYPPEEKRQGNPDSDLFGMLDDLGFGR